MLELCPCTRESTIRQYPADSDIIYKAIKCRSIGSRDVRFVLDAASKGNLLLTIVKTAMEGVATFVRTQIALSMMNARDVWGLVRSGSTGKVGERSLSF